jgi:hypothetical protein
MKETSWRTLMLMTTLFAVVLIFQGTVRTMPPKTPLIGPDMGGDLPIDCNKPQDKPALGRPKPATVAAAAPPAWLNDNLGDLNETGWFSSSDSEDAEDPNEASPPVPE